ncbi:bifunctional cytochrome P450/NADPH--P450 reductase [Paenibacillus sp. 1_12]|uniref:bifunctional cytochrome P450/NADPH--P450 reductase n=1 Tax=Paenibacillus sp. 1_12 TaxID=1566278 RepID=UPI000B8444D2|nr:bifunctional cytochrome P450/NADPH--P450 reductase [Paenibacillus sp. 1_12]
MTAPQIPQPKTYGPLGNLPLIDKVKPVQSMIKLAEEFGPIFKLELPGRTMTMISDHKLVADACDESRFDKKVHTALMNVRPFAGDGLFTADTEDPNWQKAHHILLPSFSQRAMQGYHHMMVDIATQMIQKWSRLNPDESINVPDDMTRLTLDTIGLTGFNYRFNSFYREEPHPFITSMVRSLHEAMSQLQRLGLQDKLMVLTKRQYKHDIQSMYTLVDKIIAERKAQGSQGVDDLLSHMLEGKDPETGVGLNDENIRYQIITFLIAGHETTSGLLSFAIYYLLKNPEKLQKAYEEVDRVLTGPIPTYGQVRELHYVRMVLNEALRLWPTAPMFALYAKEDTLLAGTYPVAKGEAISVLIPQLHRDKSAWGDDVDEFRPERFKDPSQIPHDAYKPFGNGQRACIGQQFALQEATLVLGMVLKHFELIDHTNYQLDIKESLTLKPDGFTIRVRPRGNAGVGTVLLDGSEVTSPPSPQSKTKQASHPDVSVQTHNTPLLILYGSNMGTAEGIARELADEAKLQGFRCEIAAMNDRAGKLPKEGAVFIVTASYNGKPPSSARTFVQWLETIGSGDLNGVQYAVFGCGDRNWANTYQYIPRLIDEQLAANGATRLAERGEADASGDFEKQLDEWKEQLWPGVMDKLGLQLNAKTDSERSTLTVQFVSGFVGTPLAESYEAVHAKVLDNRELQGASSERSTRHLEIELPEGITYQEGDHLGVLPCNRPELVERALRRYRLNSNDHLILKATGRSAAHLPLDRPVSLHDLLSHNVELQEAATRAQLRELAAYTVCPPHKKELEALLAEDVYREQVLNKRLTMLDLLVKYEACELPFERFIELLPPLKPRYYSISSSPRVQPEQASITVGVVRGPAWSGQGEYRGVASNYLAGCHVDDEVVMFIRTPESGFQLPENTETPIIMVGPGTGVAPFRGFLQARSALKRQGKKLGEAHLFFGCRGDDDYLYREELERFQEEGIVTLHCAFSRKVDTQKTYVQHLMGQNAKLLVDIFDNGGILYVCGDGSRMAPDVEATLIQAYGEVHNLDEQQAKQWLDRLQSEGRYAKDVWSGV